MYLAFRANTNKKRNKIEEETDGFKLPKQKKIKLEGVYTLYESFHHH